MKAISAKYLRCAAFGVLAAAIQFFPAMGAQSAAAVPDFSGTWRHGSLPWLVPPASGPGPVTNKSRRADNGESDYSELRAWATLSPHIAEKLGKRRTLGRPPRQSGRFKSVNLCC